MIAVLVVLAFLIAAVGGLAMSEATLGVGLICGACFVLIFARLIQAHDQHAQIMRAVKKAVPALPVTVPPETDAPH